MIIETINRHILSAYSERFHAADVVRLDPSRTLGDCRYWRIETAGEMFCLRQWPKGTPEKERMQFVQAVLWHSVCEGVDFVPLPFETLENKGFVEHENGYWELLPWIGDEEESGATSAEVREREAFQTVSAMMSLAQFHLAVSTFPLPNFPRSISPGIRNDLAEWEKWITGRFSSLFEILRGTADCPAHRPENRLAEAGLSLLNRAVKSAGNLMVLLTRAARISVPILPTIGNAHRRHLRFDDDGVYGILDLKEITIDGVSRDIATLLASLAGTDPLLWNLGIKAYRQVRPLFDEELFVLEAFDRSRLFLEALGYLERIFLHGDPCNEFQVHEIGHRLDRILSRLDDGNRSRRSA